MKAIILALFLIASCGSNKSINTPDMDKEQRTNHSLQNEVAYEIISEGPISGVKEAQIRVVKEKEGLKEIYNYLNENRSPKLLEPNINFDEEVIIALFMGEKNYGGYKISVQQIKEEEREIIVYVKETAPSGKYATTVITHPYSIFKMKKTTKEIVFKKVS